jgi:hypothetical protein
VLKYLLCCEGSCWRSRSHRRVWEPSKGALDGLGSWLLPPEAAAPSDRYHISGVRPLLPAARYKKQNRPLTTGESCAQEAGARQGQPGAGTLLLSFLGSRLSTYYTLAVAYYIARVDTPRPTANRPHAGLQININANENQYSALLMAAAPRYTY